MFFGAGFAGADDVAVHEISHGYTEKTSNLLYYAQAGAINESMSDVFGELANLSNGIGNDSPGVRWLMGEDLPAEIGAIRNMANPVATEQPDRVGSPYWNSLWADNGGVHINSGV